MSILAIDLGGTKLASAVFSPNGELISTARVPLGDREGSAVGALITSEVSRMMAVQDVAGDRIVSIGIAVPGISQRQAATVWAPNIGGWENYPLYEEMQQLVPGIPIVIDSDRICCITGEAADGAAKGCTDAIYVSVGTGIGAGVLVNGSVLRGANDIAGSIGWMALEPPFRYEFAACGYFESCASGDGIAKLTTKLLGEVKNYHGELNSISGRAINAFDVFEAYANEDKLAAEVFSQVIERWGMAIANLVSIFNPQKIILGGGVFGPALQFLEAIRAEAAKWAQPLSMRQVNIESSVLGDQAALYGAYRLALANHSLK